MYQHAGNLEMIRWHGQRVIFSLIILTIASSHHIYKKVIIFISSSKEKQDHDMLPIKCSWCKTIT